MNRRSLLSGIATAAVVGSAGCLTSPQSDEGTQHHLEVTLQNDHDRPYDARIEMTDASGDLVLENSFTIQPGEGRGFGDDYRSGTYTLEVTLTDRAALRSYWDTDLCEVMQVRTEIGTDGRVTNAVRCADRTTTTT